MHCVLMICKNILPIITGVDLYGFRILQMSFHSEYFVMLFETFSIKYYISKQFRFCKLLLQVNNNLTLQEIVLSMKDKKSRKKAYSRSRSKSQRRQKKQKSKQKHKHKRRTSDQQQSQSNDSPHRRHHRKRRDSSSSQSYKNRHKKVKREDQVKRQAINEGWQSSPERSQNNQKREKQVKVEEKPKKQQPNFEPSGILLQYYNAREGVSLKFNEPAQAHKPLNEWRIYPFKDNQPLNPIILSESCYLIGKDERVCDILCQNSSISRQHAVIQFRSQYIMEMEGDYKMEVKPYIMDLESTNGTHLNNQRIQPSRYYQLLNKDLLKFGLSEREYVMYKVPEAEENENDEDQQK